MSLLESLSRFSSLFLSIINPSLSTSSFSYTSLFRRSRSARYRAWEVTSGQRRQRRKQLSGERRERGFSIDFISMEPSWCRPRNYAGITRPGRQTNSTGGPWLSQSSELSHPRRQQRTQPLPLPPPHVAAPSPDKVSLYRNCILIDFWGKYLYCV